MNTIVKSIDNFLNKKTMYQLVFQGLIILAVVSVAWGFFGFISYGGVSLIGSLIVLSFSCYFANFLCAKLFSAYSNFESSFITALILFFTLSPATTLHEYGILVLASLIAMASKYVLAIHMKHVFNPAAISLLVLTLVGIGSALWWVATLPLLPFVVVLGLLILRKINKFTLFFTFLLTAILTMFVFAFKEGFGMMDTASTIFTSWPLLFFGMIMLTEPLSTPPTIKQQTIYGIIVGILFGAQFNVGWLYSTPQLALIVGNVYTFLVSPKYFSKLVLREKKEIASSIYEFIFTSPHKLSQIPGQYLEWTLPHKDMDSRGVRRYFTVASSPTESDVAIGIRVVGDTGSSFKKHLMSLNPGDTIVASGLTGDFTLPQDPTKKIVFIAGGIGVTPFRSMIKYLVDRREKRDIIHIYSNKIVSDIAYKDVFEQASSELGIKTLYVVNDPQSDISTVPGAFRSIDENMISTQVPDYKNRLYYISGPLGMIHAFEGMLVRMGVPQKNIKTDFFSGY